MYCEMPRSDFGNDPNWTGGKVRDLGGIRANAEAYQGAKRQHAENGHTNKFSSKDFKSCEHSPLWINEPDDMLVLLLAPPPQLHM